jgi:hypothetical protein
MEPQKSILNVNFRNGILLGLISIIYALLIWALDIMFNPIQNYVFYLIQAVFLFIFIKLYRENYKDGVLSYGQAFATGIVISALAAILYAIFIFILYSFIDNDLVNKQLAIIEESLIKSGIPQNVIESGLQLQKKMLQPAIYAPIKLLSSLLSGTIISLIVAFLVRKENHVSTYKSDMN